MTMYQVLILNTNTKESMLFKTTTDERLALATEKSLYEMLSDLPHIQVILTIENDN